MNSNRTFWGGLWIVIGVWDILASVSWGGFMRFLTLLLGFYMIAAGMKTLRSNW